MGTRNSLSRFSLLLIIFAIIAGCDRSDPVTPVPVDFIELFVNKAVYVPGDVVQFSIPGDHTHPLTVKYKFLGEVIDEHAVSSPTWAWAPPADDFKGYMAELYTTQNGSEQCAGAIAIDVSSDWTVFPRYGFLSSFHDLGNAVIEANIKRLTRHHINGVQFYDWAEKYHKPLAGTPSAPAYSWFDIANRQTNKPTIEKYISLARGAGMKTMFHTLINGSLQDAESDGVNRKWYLFRDRGHLERVAFDLGPAFKSQIYLMNPTHNEWYEYLIDRCADVYSVYNFDGIHLDQLGPPGTAYDYVGFNIDIEHGYYKSLQAMHWANEFKNLTFTFVNTYGWSGTISAFSLDFIYAEVDDPNDEYDDLAKFFTTHTIITPEDKKIVLAAYIHKGSEVEGYFNTPSVLLADAVIFAFGGSHIELGEHLLSDSYFPNDRLSMTPDLENRLVSYYDFLVAYQNILRDGGELNFGPLTSLTSTVDINAWPPQPGKVTCFGKAVNNRQVFHLINFTDATTLQWQDNEGIQAKPNLIENIEVKFTSTAEVKKVWFASPDVNGGASISLDFRQDDLKVSFKIPSLEYWSMVVIEH